jgi:hypothetical protein
LTGGETVKEVHYSELREYAVRDRVERGLRYARVHSGVPYASAWVALTGVVQRSFREVHPGTYPQAQLLQRNPLVCLGQASTIFPGEFFLNWTHASDMGLWDVPGISYHNEFNYLLDLNDLLRQGIRVTGLS